MRQNEHSSRIVCLAVVACVAAVSTPARAAELITNGSFENTAGTFVSNGLGYMDLPSGSVLIPGWTTTNNPLA